MSGPDTVQVQVEDVVLKPVGEVFDAVVDPAALSRYFVSGASGRLEPGATVEWTFADAGACLAVTVKETDRPHRIVFTWSASGAPTEVRMTFDGSGSDRTTVEVTDADFPLTPEGVGRALETAAGWTDFLCCLKADLEFGIRLRQRQPADAH
jgi:uncharacterized protein YndB with AHSA1/START domain